MRSRFQSPGSGFAIRIAAGIFALAALVEPASAQNFERYRPFIIDPAPSMTPNLRGIPDRATGSDEVLIDRLDAVIVLEDIDDVDQDSTNDDAIGLITSHCPSSNVVTSNAFEAVVYSYIGRPVTLRNLNQMARDVVLLYRRMRRPIVDVVIPEQKITGGTVQIVVVESRVDRVLIEGAEHFDPCFMSKWIECTQRGNVIFEPWVDNDLFWLNQNPFRRVDVDLRPGSFDGSTDVVFRVDDVVPIRGYLGYDDTGVLTLGRERLSAGLIYGNAFGKEGILSYQYTTDGDLRRLHAHSVSYVQPIDRDYTYAAYGSWASSDPTIFAGLLQGGESWQVGTELRKHLEKNQWVDESFAIGMDFKSTNNNLEFGGIVVQNSNADLIQLRANYERITRDACDQYSIFRAGAFVGPGDGFTSRANAASFGTIRPGTSPDYIYGRISYEEAVNVGRCDQWQLLVRGVGQVASERLLFSEMLGFGGFDTIRGYDQRTLNGDHGWQLNFEFGPRPHKFCCHGEEGRFRAYTFLDMGDSYIQNPLPGENSQEFLTSVGVGMRLNIGQSLALRMDYGYGFEEVPIFPNDRLHLGLIWLFGPLP